MKYFVYSLMLVLMFTQCGPGEEPRTSLPVTAQSPIPESIKEEHAYLLSKVKDLSLLNDSTGRAAKRLLEVMQHHFSEEEEYVLPPLVLLPVLTNDSIPANAQDVIVMTDKLKSQSSHLDAEHQMIKALLDEVAEAAVNDNHPEVAGLQRELINHAMTEEEIIFPSALLVGEYLKLKLPVQQ